VISQGGGRFVTKEKLGVTNFRPKGKKRRVAGGRRRGQGEKGVGTHSRDAEEKKRKKRSDGWKNEKLLRKDMSGKGISHSPGVTIKRRGRRTKGFLGAETYFQDDLEKKKNNYKKGGGGSLKAHDEPGSYEGEDETMKISFWEEKTKKGVGNVFGKIKKGNRAVNNGDEAKGERGLKKYRSHYSQGQRKKGGDLGYQRKKRTTMSSRKLLDGEKKGGLPAVNKEKRPIRRDT